MFFFSFRVFPFLQFFITFPLSLLFLASSATLRLSLHHHSALVVFLPFAFNHANRMLFQYLCQVSSRPWCCHFTFLSHSLCFEREESFEIQCGYGFRSHGYIVRDISMLTTLRGQLLWTFSVKMKTFYAIREILRDPAHFNSLMRFQPLSPDLFEVSFCSRWSIHLHSLNEYFQFLKLRTHEEKVQSSTLLSLIFPPLYFHLSLSGNEKFFIIVEKFFIFPTFRCWEVGRGGGG